MWSMIGTHVLLQSFGLKFGTPLDLVPSLVAPTIPKLMVRRRDSTKRWNKPLDVCWLSSSCLKQNGVICYNMLSLPSNQQLQGALGALHLSWYMGKGLGYLLISLWEARVGCLVQLASFSTSSS